MTEGAYIPDLDTSLICSRIIECSSDIAWIAINFRGNIANVEIIELSRADNTVKPGNASNLVSQYDAVVDTVELSSGEAVVKGGQSVAKGDLLVSGALEGINGTVFVRSEGRIMGVVTDTIEVHVPIKQEKKVVKNKKCVAISLDFFTKEINIFKYSRNLPMKYDTIYSREQIYLFGKFKLPIYLRTESLVEYEAESSTICESEAVRLAARRMNEALVYELRDGELLRTSLRGEFDENGYHLICVFDSLRNIAVSSELEISE